MITCYEDFVRTIQLMNKENEYSKGRDVYKREIDEFISMDYEAYQKYTKRMEREFLQQKEK